jgi:putative acetyltransferase
MSDEHPLRPYLPADAMPLREIFAQSIEELTQDDYDEDQRLAWISAAADGAAFAKKLASMLTLVVEAEGEHLGFASLRDNSVIEMLYVHPYHAGEGIGTTLVDALEKIAAARGAESITADASDTAALFFEARGYKPESRNSVPMDDQWLTNTTMKKVLKPAASKPVPKSAS